MSFQVCIQTDKSMHQLATEMCRLLALPPFREDTSPDGPYCQFEMLGMLVLIHYADEEDRDQEVSSYPHTFDLQMSFTEHRLDTDEMEYQLQPYYAQLLSFQLGVKTAFHEKQKTPTGWKIRYRFFNKNSRWNETILYGEPGWQPAVLEAPASGWRAMYPVF